MLEDERLVMRNKTFWKGDDEQIEVDVGEREKNDEDEVREVHQL